MRVDYTEPLPYQLSHYLDELQYARWNGDEDTEPLIQQILDAIRQFADLKTAADTEPPKDDQTSSVVAPKPYADPRFLETLYEPGGAVRARSDFYIERAGDEMLRRELTKPHGTTTTIRASRQTGKSSLLVRGVAQARRASNRKVVYIDLQPLEPTVLTSLDSFLHYIAANIITQLRLDLSEVEKAWQSSLGAPDKTTYLFEDYIIP